MPDIPSSGRQVRLLITEDGRLALSLANEPDPNKLTTTEILAPWAGTPWHRTVPAQLEQVPA
jgi:hypothetical protein